MKQMKIARSMSRSIFKEFILSYYWILLQRKVLWWKNMSIPSEKISSKSQMILTVCECILKLSIPVPDR